MIREIECLVESSVSILSERRETAPWGLDGGGDGARGVNWLIRGRRRTKLAAKTNLLLRPGDRIRIETPGAGGFGAATIIR